MELGLNKKREDKIQEKDISNIKNAVNAPGFGNTPGALPPGLESAPSPSMEEKQKKNIQHTREELPPTKRMGLPLQRPSAVAAPSPSGVNGPVETSPSQERSSFDVIEEIAESIISEKWNDLIKNVGDLKLWKERIDTDLSGVKQEIVRTQGRLEDIQNSVMGKVSEYGEGMNEITAELKALESVMEKIMNPLTRSVKELQKVTEKIVK